MKGRLRYLPLLTALILGLAAAGSALTATERRMDKHVRARIELMTMQKAAMITLGDMAAGRTAFDAGTARSARRTLIKTTGAIRKAFRKERMDPESNALPALWRYWDDFEQRAGTAGNAARDLNAASLAGLRRTLPGLLHACLSCHETYRATPKEFTTH